jgi:hypothetical protein
MGRRRQPTQIPVRNSPNDATCDLFTYFELVALQYKQHIEWPPIEIAAQIV